MSASTISAALGRCHYYRTVCGLPCHVDDSGRIAVTVGGRLQAVTVPEPLGRRMRELLVARALVGPIVGHRSRRYTFLTNHSPEAEDESLYAGALLRTNSHVVPPSCLVALPFPNDDGSYRRWVEPARDRFRPRLGTVLDTLLECAR